MQTSYKQLITEHDAIEAAANALLAAVDKGYASSTDLAVQLHTLAIVVEDHVEREDLIIAGLDETQLSGPWIEAWREGADAFVRLKSDWTLFLKTWNAEAIRMTGSASRPTPTLSLAGCVNASNWKPEHFTPLLSKPALSAFASSARLRRPPASPCRSSATS